MESICAFVITIALFVLVSLAIIAVIFAIAYMVAILLSIKDGNIFEFVFGVFTMSVGASLPAIIILYGLQIHVSLIIPLVLHICMMVLGAIMIYNAFTAQNKNK